MAAIYGHRWTSAFDGSPEDGSGGMTIVGDTWQRGLSGIAERAIADGLQACMVSADPWPPTLPAFRAMCFDIPSFGQTRIEVLGIPSERSPFTTLAMSQLDTHRYKLADADKADRLLKEAYDFAREHVMEGGALPERVTHISHARDDEKRTPASDETARECIARMRRALDDPEPEAA